MRFKLIDRVVEAGPDRAVGEKLVSLAEEYLYDHFEGYPVLPGVLMIEAMVEAARVSLERRLGPPGRRYVVGRVRAMKYGAFVRPGETLRVEVEVSGEGDDGAIDFKGSGRLLGSDGAERQTAVSGRFSMRPIRRGDA
jgi:3-hydroxyacyl-[acyl-carrier-protein] dehydratase